MLIGIAGSSPSHFPHLSANQGKGLRPVGMHPPNAVLPLGEIHNFTTEEAQQLLHNKFVAVLGDSIHRSIYKDMIYFLQTSKVLTIGQLKLKGSTFANDVLVEGGERHNKTSYDEVRQYRTNHHLVRLYFLTRVYSDYLESVVSDFIAGPPPDVLIVNSCLWDLNRYNNGVAQGDNLDSAFEAYRQNLRKLFQRLTEVLPPTCLVIWNTSMPLGPTVRKAYLDHGMENQSTPVDVIKANFYSATMACCYMFDVLDLNYSFRFLESQRDHDGVHWDGLVHRFITKLLLTHIANAWGVEIKRRKCKGIKLNGAAASPFTSPRLPPPLPPPYLPRPHPPPHNGFSPLLLSTSDPYFQNDSFSGCFPMNGYINFEHDQEPRLCPEAEYFGGFHNPGPHPREEHLSGFHDPCPGPLPREEHLTGFHDPGPLPREEYLSGFHDPGPLPREEYLSGFHDPGPLPREEYLSGFHDLCPGPLPTEERLSDFHNPGLLPRNEYLSGFHGPGSGPLPTEEYLNGFHAPGPVEPSREWQPPPNVRPWSPRGAPRGHRNRLIMRRGRRGVAPYLRPQDGLRGPPPFSEPPFQGWHGPWRPLDFS